MQTRLSPAHPDAGTLTFLEIEDRIRTLAYQLYVDRGRANGHSLDDWLEAKAQVLGVSSKSSADSRRRNSRTNEI